MKVNVIDTYIFVKSKDGSDHRPELVDTVKNVKGIVTARMHPRISKLIEVSYNPQHIDGSHIISAIQAKGCHSALIGM